MERQQDVHLGAQGEGPGSGPRAAERHQALSAFGEVHRGGGGENGASEAGSGKVTAGVVRRVVGGAGSLCHMFRPLTPRHGSVRDERPWLPG